VGDLILALDGQATRDIAELIRVLGAMTPGQRVRVSVRREGAERDVTMTLVVKP
jgi:S1-C subfamily serine protease